MLSLTRSVVVLCILTIGATGCSDQLRRQILPQQPIPGTLPQTWTRVDGQPVDATQLDVKKTTVEAKWTIARKYRSGPGQSFQSSRAGQWSTQRGQSRTSFRSR